MLDREALKRNAQIMLDKKAVKKKKKRRAKDEDGGAPTPARGASSASMAGLA